MDGWPNNIPKPERLTKGEQNFAASIQGRSIVEIYGMAGNGADSDRMKILKRIAENGQTAGIRALAADVIEYSQRMAREAAETQELREKIQNPFPGSNLRYDEY